MQKLSIVKIGGNVVDNAGALKSFLGNYARLDGLKILVHGGGKVASAIGEKLGIKAQMLAGRRITDAETLKVVTMVYAGLVNKNLVAQLQANGLNSIGLCGADGNIIAAVKRPVKDIDYGFVGDILPSDIGTDSLSMLLKNGFSPVIAPITHDNHGQLLNTNADTIAATIAAALGTLFEVKLFYCFEKKGVLRNPEDDQSVIPEIDQKIYEDLKSQGIISDGMIPKLDNAFMAINNGVKTVHTCRADDLIAIAEENKNAGTVLC